MRLLAIFDASGVNYISAPEVIVSDSKKHFVMRFGHFIPSVVLTLVLVVKVLPDYIDSLRVILENNSFEIWGFVIPTFIISALLFGILIENIFVFTNVEYRKLKRGEY